MSEPRLHRPVALAIHAAVCEKIGAHQRHIRGPEVAHNWEARQLLASLASQGVVVHLNEGECYSTPSPARSDPATPQGEEPSR